MINLNQVDSLNGSHEQSSRVYSDDGICPTIMAGSRKQCTGGYISPKILLSNTNKNKLNVEYNGGIFMDKKIKLFDSFSGVGALHSALKRLGVDVELIGISEVDPDAIINYGAIHSEQQNNIEIGNKISTLSEKREWLMERNIGWDFTKQKSSIPRMKKDKLEKLFEASVNCNNFGDISKLNYDEIPDFDLFNFSFPCTDISVAGQQKGLKNEDGTHTRSGLVKFGLDVIRAKKPKYIMIENVKGLIQKKFIDDFYGIIDELDEIGYNCHYPTKEDKKGDKKPCCLNAKDFGVPQNRERIFIICIRKDIDKKYEFPKGFPLEIRLKDVLEDSVDNKYYLSKEIQDRFTRFPNNKLNNEDLEVLGTTALNPRKEDGALIYDKCTSAWVYNKNKLMSTLSARDYKQPKQIIDNKYFLNDDRKEFFISNSFNMENKGNGFRFEPHIKENANVSKCITTRSGDRMDDNFILYNSECKDEKLKFDSKNGTIRGRYNSAGKVEQELELREDGVAPASKSQRNGLNVVDGGEFKIRKLTPLECWRLMSFSDEEFYKAKSTRCSDSQLYKQAGNSIVVDVLYYIFKNLLEE